MSYCDTCIHRDVCGVEGANDEATVYCADRMEPCKEAVSRQAVLGLAYDMSEIDGEHFSEPCMVVDVENIQKLPPVNPQEPKTWQFAKWVASEIFDDNWEYNKDAFDELACRKLAKLGIVRLKGDEWELVEPQGSEDNGYVIKTGQTLPDVDDPNMENDPRYKIMVNMWGDKVAKEKYKAFILQE